MENKEEFKPGIYQHFKGDSYYAMMVGKHSETEEDMVVYIPLYYKEEAKTRVWIRPLDNFMGYKEKEDGTKIKRFTFISER